MYSIRNVSFIFFLGRTLKTPLSLLMKPASPRKSGHIGGEHAAKTMAMVQAVRVWDHSDKTDEQHQESEIWLW